MLPLVKTDHCHVLYCGNVQPVSVSDSAPSQSAFAPPLSLPSAEDVRALARLLREAELSEIAWEDTSGAHAQKLILRRSLLATAQGGASTGQIEIVGSGQPLTAEPLAAVTAGAEGIESVSSQPAITALPALTVASPVVGIFQSATPPLEVGATLKAGQILGYVESMRVPNEVRTTSAGVLSAVLCLPGQGVEYGQLLFEITVEPQEVTP